MIDLAQEHLVPLRDVPQHLPPRPSGKRLHISAVYRWVLHGVRGHRLETVKVGGTTYTSREALQRFADRLTRPGEQPTAGRVSTAARQRQVDRAAHEVRRILGSGAQDGPPQGSGSG